MSDEAGRGADEERPPGSDGDGGRGSDDEGVDRPRALLALFAVTVAVGLLWAGSTSTAAYDPYNPTGEGTSEFRGQLDADPDVEREVLRDADGYERLDPDETVAIVVPSASVAAEDPDAAARLGSFVEEGGTLVLLVDDRDAGNAFLSGLDAGARLDSHYVRDERQHHRGPIEPIATTVNEHPLTEGVDRLEASHARAIQPNGATPLVSSSESGYLVADRTESYPPDAREESDFPIAAVEEIGDGRVVVTDASIASNELIERGDNARFLANAYAEHDRVALDLSQSAAAPPLAQIREAARGQTAP